MRPKTLGDLLGKDLAGFEMTEVFYLEPKHGTKASGSVIEAETRQPVISLDCVVLAGVSRQLPPRPYNVKSMMALVNRVEGLGFLFDKLINQENKPFHLFTAEDLARFASLPGSFSWA